MRGLLQAGLALATCAVLSVSAKAGTITVRISDEVAPPGGMVQMKVLFTSPMPITSGGMFMDMGLVDFASIDGIALFAPNGDAVGAAVVDGGKISMQAVSPNGTFGTTLDYPVMTVAMRLKSTAQVGQSWPVSLGSATYWQDLLGSAIPVENKPGSITVGGSLSITNVLPGGGILPAGATFRIIGMGFTPLTKVQVNPMAVQSIQYVSPTEIRVTVKSGGLLDGTKIIVQNPDKSTDTYYSYLRGVPVGVSNRALLQLTVPAFSTNTMYDGQLASTISPLLNPDYFTAIAIQNPNAADAVVTVEAHAADGALTGSTALTLPAGGRISREASELFGAVLPTGAYLRVKSASAVQAMGLLGNDVTHTVAPLAMQILSAGPTGPVLDSGAKNGGGGSSGGSGKTQ
jgi:hypothetical protein